MKIYFLKLLFITLFILAGDLLLAQDDKPSIGVLKLDANNLPNHKAVKINKYVESAFYKSNRFNIVTRQLRESIDGERELQKANIENIAIQQGKAIGADYIIRGKAQEYKQKIYKSSPQSRAPRRTTQQSTSRTSPRSKTETKKETDQKAKTSSKVFTTDPKANTKNKKTSSPRSNTKQISKVPNTNPKKSTSAKTKQGSKVAKPATSPVRNSSKKSEEKTSEKKTQTTAVPLSNEIDRIYTSTRISFTIEIIDVKTGVIVQEDTYNGSINRINYFVQDFVKKAFPFEFQILEILEMKGDKKAKNLLIYGGEKQGLKVGNYLKVFEVSEENVDGRILRREVEVGRLYVLKLDTGGNFSLCRIIKGKKTILGKLNQKVKLVCR